MDNRCSRRFTRSWRALTFLAFETVSCLACAEKRARPPEQSVEASAGGRGEPATVAQNQKADPAPTPVPSADWKKELSGLPESVLVGTDVIPLAEFLASATPIPLTGTYQCEQGGATAEVHLETNAKGRTLTRRFAEPGTAAQVRRYDDLRSQANGMRLSSKDLEIVGTKQSILVLEKDSLVDGIPAELWIEYQLKSSEVPAK